MNELFRFVAIRPPQKDLPVFTLRIARDSSPLIVDLFTARLSQNPREGMIRVASDFQATDGFIAAPEELAIFSGLIQFGNAVDGEEQIDLADLEQRVLDVLGQSAQAVQTSQDFRNHERVLSDSIVAIKITPVDDVSLLAELSHLIRLMDLV